MSSVKRDDKRPVRFIRRNGRIIPIHISRGLGQVAAGVGVGAASGLASAAIANAPKAASKVAKKVMAEGFVLNRIAEKLTRAPKILDKAQMTLPHLGAAASRAPKILDRFRFANGITNAANHGPRLAIPVFLAGTAVSSAFFAAGAQNLLKKAEKNDVKRSLVSDTLATAGFVVTGAAYLRGIGVKPLGKAIRKTISVVPGFLKHKVPGA